MGEAIRNRNILNRITTHQPRVSVVSSAVNSTMQIASLYVLQAHSTTTSPNFKGLFRNYKVKAPTVFQSSMLLTPTIVAAHDSEPVLSFLKTYYLQTPFIFLLFHSTARDNHTEILYAQVSGFRIN
jgi:hypothetical protein